MKTTVLGFDQPDEPTNLETVTMTIDEASVQHIMGTLTSLYADPLLAVLREYSSNAVDSHVRAGVYKPIAVTIPSEYNTNFVVQDFGIGMSKDDIANIYSRYGLSTKGNTNAEIGAFGLGCKSALAIAERFDITAVKDGVETVAFIQKNNKGVGVVHFVSETSTSKDNGVVITIPINPTQVGRFADTAKTFFDTWAVGSALINGEPNKAVQYGSGWIEIAPAGSPIAWVNLNKTASFQTYRSYNNLISNSTFIIGGIGYSLERVGRADFPFETNDYKKLSNIVNGNKLIVNLPIGSVDLTPSREAIMITDKTVKSINSMITDIAENIRATVTDYLQGLTIDEALRVYAGNFHLFADEVDLTGSGYSYRQNARTRRPEFYGVKYQNEEIPTWIDVTDKSYYELNSIEGQALGFSEKATRVYTINSLNTVGYSGSSTPDNIIVVADNVDDVTTDTFRKNLRDYAKAKYGRTTVNAVFTDDTALNKWVKATYAEVTFADFVETARKYRTAKKSEAQTGSKRSAVSYAMTDLNPTSANYETIVKVSADAIKNDGKDVIFVSADVDKLVNFVDPWTAVGDTLKGGSSTHFSSSGFADFAYKAFGSKQIVFINKGKSSAAFVKKFPKAVAYQDAIITSVKQVIKTGEGDILAGVASAVYNIADNGTLLSYSAQFPFAADSLNAFGVVNNIKDVAVRTAFASMGANNKMTAIARMLSEINIQSNVSLNKFYGQILDFAYGKRFSLINRLEMGRYYQTLKLDENDVKQLVALINAC